MSFRATGLPLSPFEPLFALDDEALAAQGMRRMVADAKPAASASRTPSRASG